MSGSGSRRLPDPSLITSRWRHLKFKYLGTSLARRRAVRQVIIGATATVVAATVHNSISEARQARADWGSTRAVVIMTGPIAPGEMLSRSDLRVERVPRALVPAGVVVASRQPGGQVGALVGLRVASTLERGEILTQKDLADRSGGRISAQVASGSAAVTIQVDERQPPVEVGDLIDIYGERFTTDDGFGLGASGSGSGDSAISRLATSARVVGLDDDSMTVIVSQSEVVAVLAAEAAGRVFVVISN